MNNMNMNAHNNHQQRQNEDLVGVGGGGGGNNLFHQHQQHIQQQQQQHHQQQHHHHHQQQYNQNSSSNNIIRNSSSNNRQSLTWSRIDTPGLQILPPPRSGAASVVLKNKLYMFGGYGGGTGRLDDFYSYSFDTGTWEEVNVLSEKKPGCRENNGVVIGDESRVYLFGGYNGTLWLNDLWMFDIDTQRWTCIQESSDPNANNQNNNNNNQNNNNNNDGFQVVMGNGGNGSNVDAALGDHPNNGGGGGSGSGVGLMSTTSTSAGSTSTTIRSINITDNLANSNHAVRGKVPSRRFGYVSVVHNNKFVLFGGFDGTRWLNDMYEFNFITKVWTEIQQKGILPSVRSCPAWAKDDTHVYIQGGYDGVERKSDFFSCDLATYTWNEISPCLGSSPSPRYFHSCCLYGSKMYLYGGYSGSERLSDMYAYDFETNHWTEIDCTNGDCPSGRSSLVAQVYENCLFIFGGYNGVTVLNDFYKFRLKPVSVPPPLLVNDLRCLLNNSELSDVTFLVEGKEIYANKAILAVRSEYFKVMLFSGGMKESIQLQQSGNNNDSNSNNDVVGSKRNFPSSSSASSDNNCSSAPIELKDVSYPVFLKVLEYLYTDTVRNDDNMSLDVGIHLLIMSERFMLDRLKSLCEDNIRRDINVDNVIGILIAAHRHHATGLKDIALEFILKNLNVPQITIGLSDLKSEPDLLVEIIKRNSLSTSSTTSGGVSNSSNSINASTNNGTTQINTNNNNGGVAVLQPGLLQQQQHHHPAGPFGR